MRHSIVLLLLSAFSCAADDATAQAPDTPNNGNDGSTPDPERCGQPVAMGSSLDIPHDGNNGVFDPSLAHDPTTDLLWMSYSSVTGTAGDGAFVSTYLAYSEDAGATWCLSGTVNQATSVAPNDRPAPLRNQEAHWNHEVSTLVHHPSAAPNERWQLFWHRYLEAVDEDPNTDDRRFEYGWIGHKSATSPEGLLEATERKLIAATAYRSVAAYNDTILGPPEIDFSTNSDLSGCLAFTEPGSLAQGEELFLSLICSDALEQSARLLKRNQSGTFDFVSTLVDRALAQSILDAAVGPGAPMASGVSASELTRVDEDPVLIVSPVVRNYRGCWFFPFNVATGAVTPTPSRVVEHTPGTILSGICDYHPAATALGIVFGEATFDRPQFRVYATGVSP